MNDISVVALFCSDVRQEKGGTDTIVGVFPDNVNLPKIPGAFPQMQIYVRMHLRSDFRPEQIVTRIVLPDGSEVDRNTMEPDLIQRTSEQALANKAPYMGLIARFVMAPMHITQEGRMQVVVSVDGKDYVAGALNCREVTT